MRPKLQVAPLYLRKVRDLEGIDGRYFGILSGLPPAGRHRSPVSLREHDGRDGSGTSFKSAKSSRSMMANRVFCRNHLR